MSSDDSYITFEEAAMVLQKELNYPEDRAVRFVQMFDHNKDGQLSASEFTQFRKNIEDTKKLVEDTFGEFDADKNGYLTLDEASTILRGDPFRFPPDKVLCLLRRFDRDGNGKLDYREFGGFYAEARATNEEISTRFKQLDKDGNGMLSQDEVSGVLQQLMGFDEAMARYLIEMFDTNHDGQLDKTEFVQMWSGMFGC